MLNRISISQHPIEFLIDSIGTIIPGIEKVRAYYFDERDFKVKCIEYSDNKISSPPFNDSELTIVQRQRGLTQKYEWFKENFELFNNTGDNQFQTSISDSTKQNLLCLRFQNPIDHLQDMIFIHFDGKIGTLKLSLAEEVIKPEEKNIIERLLHNNISFLLRNERNNKKLYQNVLNNVENLKVNNNSLKKEVIEKSDSYEKSISYFCKSYVYKIAKEENVNLNITNDAIKKIINDSIPFDKIEPLLNQTIEMCLNRSLHFDNIILIDEFDLIIPKLPKVVFNNNKEEVVINDRYAKTKEYLDRYEKAAEQIVKDGVSLTGMNLGAYCSPKITPAAISDNIKKHRSKIITLLHRYNEKWPIVRENYRPIRKLLDTINTSTDHDSDSFKKAI